MINHTTISTNIITDSGAVSLFVFAAAAEGARRTNERGSQRRGLQPSLRL